jgi:murein DD-endopeptidase MepM/ murein hydrolase activator NlpD
VSHDTATTTLPQPLTRRALREAERAGGVARTPADEPTSTRALDAAPAPAPRTGAGRHRWLSRSAVLGALGVMTIAGPLSGSTTFGLSSAAAATAAPVALAAPAPGVVDALNSGAAEIGQAEALQADPEAQTRAITAASRSYLREAVECPVESVANGTLSAVMGGEQQTTLIKPVAEGSYRITSDYGPRSYPFPGMHEGTDFAGTIGTPLYAVADGVVTYAGGPRDGRSGQIVVVESVVGGQKVEFWYGHMYTDGVYVSVGETVEIGEVIAGIGNNGNSTGPHVHFEVHIDGQTTDPLAFFAANGAETPAAVAACAA